MEFRFVDPSQLKSFTETMLGDFFRYACGSDWNQYTAANFNRYFVSLGYFTGGNEWRTSVVEFCDVDDISYTARLVDQVERILLLSEIGAGEVEVPVSVISADYIFFNYRPVLHKPDRRIFIPNSMSKAEWREYWREYYKIPGTRQRLVTESVFYEAVEECDREKWRIRHRTRDRHVYQDVDLYDILPRGRRAAKSWKTKTKTRKQWAAKKGARA